MNQKQKLFSEFFKTMIEMRKILDQTLESSNDNKISTLFQMQALEYIRDHQQITAGELASSLNISSSSLTQLTDRMIHAKLICRTHSETDRRSIYLTLTDSGKKHLKKTMKSIEAQTSEILAPMSEDDLKKVISIFNNILEKQDEN